MKKTSYIPVRYIIAILITLLEIAAVIGAVMALCYYVPYFYIAAWLTEIYCIVRIIASDDNPDYKVPWLLFVMILPITGFMLYFMFYSRTLKPKFIKRLKAIKDSSYNKDDTLALVKLKEEAPMAHSQAKMLTDIADTHVFTNTAQRYFPLGEDMFQSLVKDLEGARKFIYMEYFIIEDGIFWDTVLDILKRKAKCGVDVKVIYDDIGCMLTLPGDYCKTLRSYGIDAATFSKLRGNADSEFNNRNHRKITVIDGKIGYTGGINLADEYINAYEKYGHWKDTGIRLEGEAVWELTKLFLIDFGINVKRMPKITENLFPEAENIKADGYVIPFGDGPSPIFKRRVSKTLLQNMLSSALDYVYITTPYLIIDNGLCQSIENAALRGVKVKIITPRIPDKKLIFQMTRSFYPRLMAAGVEIYEYAPGFIHAKSCIADNNTAVVGTVNLDYRSLVHHFENGVWMYGCQCAKALKEDIEATLEKCIKITPNMLTTSLPQKAFRALVRIFAPLM